VAGAAEGGSGDGRGRCDDGDATGSGDGGEDDVDALFATGAAGDAARERARARVSPLNPDDAPSAGTPGTAAGLGARLDAGLAVHLAPAATLDAVAPPPEDELDAPARVRRDTDSGSTVAAAAHPLATAVGPGGGPVLLEVVSLYASQSAEAQARAFAPATPGRRKVILATNVAETSVTVPGVRFVVDAGLVKRREWCAASASDRLVVGPISRAQARQRAGRAGREGPGTAIRLYTEASFRNDAIFAETTPPEILRSCLASAVLGLASLGLAPSRLLPRRLPPGGGGGGGRSGGGAGGAAGDVDPDGPDAPFPWLDPPPRAALLRALERLVALGALEGTCGRLSAWPGRHMAALPLDPPEARSVAEAARGADADGGRCLARVIDSVAAAQADGVFLQTWSGDGTRGDADRARAAWRSPEGDHVALGATLRAWLAEPRSNRSAWARRRGLGARALGRAADIRRQLRRHPLLAPRLAADVDARDGTGAGRDASGAAGADADSIDLRRALAAGFFPSASLLQPDGSSYRILATGREVHVHPGSALGRHRPRCVVFAEAVRTTRLWARTVTAVDEEWLAEVAPRFFARRAMVERAGGAAAPGAARSKGGEEGRAGGGGGGGGSHRTRVVA